MRTWVDSYERKPKDKRWVMRCEGGQFSERPGSACTVTSEPFDQQPALDIFIARGWFIAEKSGDLCPGCWASGRAIGIEPHPLMARAIAAAAEAAVTV